MILILRAMAGCVCLGVLCAAAAAQESHAPKASRMADAAAAYLRSQQDPKTGGWSVNPSGPNFPAITGLVLTGLVMDPKLDSATAAGDPSIQKGVGFVLSFRQPDGGIYDQALPSYNTAICLSALTRIDLPEARAAVKPAQEFLKSLQFGEGAVVRPTLGESAKSVEKDHSFYGGWGYGKHGRPDLSNTSWVLDALHESGVEPDDAAFQRALVFLARTQMVDAVNDMPYADGTGQGGFIYATGENKDKMGVGQSFAGTIDETLDDGTKVSRLRAYGSMTYAGFKSYVHANLSKDDPRVTAALGWISKNYTLKENPGLGTDGMYYYYVTFAKAMSAFGEPVLTVESADGTTTERWWAADLTDRLAELQKPDGSFTSVDDRWMESDPVLITAYALVALRHAGR